MSKISNKKVISEYTDDTDDEDVDNDDDDPDDDELPLPIEELPPLEPRVGLEIELDEKFPS